MYVLFLILMNDNGFSFNCPSSRIQMQRYKEKTVRFQKQYEIVYGFMGGDKDKTPNVGSAEIRRPIFSRIKKSLMVLSDMLYNVNDYLITKNSYGTYNVNVEPNMIYVKDWKTGGLLPCSESDSVERIEGL